MKRIDRRFVIVMGASLFWGLLVATVFYRVAGGGSGPGRRAETEKPLVVAAQTLSVGAMITRETLQLRKVPERFFPAGGFSRVEDALDRPVISPMQAGEPVLETRIAVRGAGLGLAPMIPAGMRAISVRVNDVVGVAGFLLPGMRVDVLVTGRPPGRTDTYTRTVLQNITVMSAGQTIQTDGKSQSIATPVVTLLVNPADAEVLTLANNEGRIQLVLRNSSDNAISAARGRQTMELFAAGADPAPAPATPAVSPPAPASRPRRVPPPPVVSPAVVPLPVPAAAPDPVQVLLIRGSAKSMEAAGKRPGERQ
jgi:pilus assembly protein CpaB